MVISVTVPVRVYRANCGFPDVDELNRHGEGARYEDVCRELRKYALEKGLHSKITARGKTLQAMRGEDVAVLTVSLRRYLDHFFGRERVTNGRDRKSTDLIPLNESRGKFTLWPRRLFDDLHPQGSLISILKALLSFAYMSEMFNLDFLDDLNNKPFNSAQQGIHLKLATFIDAQLKKKNWISSFKIYLALPPSQQIQTLVNVVQAHGATVVSAPEKATHVIYPDQYGTTEACTDAHVVVRILKRRSFKQQHRENEGKADAVPADECLLHWLFHPDSYDHWVPGNEVLGHVYQPKHRRQNQQWHVQARFLRDLDRYHEWMNELDYEMPLSFSDFVNTTAEEHDKTLLPSPSLPPIRLFLRVAAKPVRKRLLNLGGNAINKDSGNDRTMPRKIQLPTIDLDKQAVDAIITDGDDDDDQPLLPASSSETPSHVPSSEGRVAINKDNNNNVRRDVVEKIKVNDHDSEDPLWMPAFSSWFDMRFVHDLEKRAVPEFFDRSSPSKTEVTYKEVRNFMIRAWRKQPTKYLTATSARKRLIGDACPILRVHSFLEHWGLINFECTPFGSGKLAPSSAQVQTQAAWMPSSSSPSSSAIFQPTPNNNTSATNEAEAQAIPLAIPPPPLPPPRPLPGAAGIADHIAVRKGSHIITDDGRKTLIRSHGVVIKCDHDGNVPSSEMPAPSSPTPPGMAALERTRARLSAGWQHQLGHTPSAIGYLNASNNNKTPSSDDKLGPESIVRFPNPHRRRRHDGGRRSSAMIAHVEYHCDSCGTDCSDIRFHCAVRADVDLCANCYREGKYAADITAKDFVQMSSLALSSSFHHLRREKLLTENERVQSGKVTANDGGGGDGGDGVIQNGDVNVIDSREMDEDYEPGNSSLDWSDDETILLLEALEMYADNWELVAEHVGSKTKAQCVMHMMRLPIEDSFLKGVAQHWWSKHPEQNNDLPSPYDLVRSCGPREAAIATISAKGAAFKTFSGLPVVYADQIHTVVAFADLLASLGAPEMIAEILDGMGVVRNRDKEFQSAQGGNNKRGGDDDDQDEDRSKMGLSWGHGRKTDFLRLLRYTHNDSRTYGRKQEEQGHEEGNKKSGDGGDDVDMLDITTDSDADANADTGDGHDLAKSMTEDELIENVIGNSLYKSLIKEVKAPHDVAVRDYGRAITRASVDLVRDGTISDDAADQLHIEDSECDIYKEVREDERQGMASAMEFDEDFDDDDEGDDDDYGGGDAKEDTIVEDGEDANNNNKNGDDATNMDKEKRRRRRKEAERVRVEDESSCAVAMTGLCCASASASEWAAIEDVEVERLREVIVEMKLEIVRRKLAQLDEVLRGERSLKAQMKRKRELDMCERTIGRKLRRVD